MTRPAEWALSVLAAAAFSAVWVVAVVSETPGTFADVDAMLIWWAATALPGVFAAWLLIRATHAESAVDGPARLLSVVTAGRSGARRREWGAAMLAELAAVPDRGARWRFAAGCARVALFPPRGGRDWAIAAVAVVAAGVVVALVLPGLTLFTVVFAAVVAVTTFEVPRRPSVAGIVAGAGVVACVGAVAYLLVAHPPAADWLSPASAVVLAVLLAVAARVALSPQRLGADRLATGVGIGAAALLAAGFAAAARVLDVGMAPYVILVPILVFFLAAALTAALRRSFRAGVWTALWTALAGAVWLFVLWLVESARWHRAGMGLLLDAESPYPIGANLGDAIVWTLAWVPVWGLPLGVLGAALGHRLTRRAG